MNALQLAGAVGVGATVTAVIGGLGAAVEAPMVVDDYWTNARTDKTIANGGTVVGVLGGLGLAAAAHGGHAGAPYVAAGLGVAAGAVVARIGANLLNS
jgi:hypothetical protein